ncbi:hypothetical protein pb186bvf_004017 [Paramecium bursaria]
MFNTQITKLKILKTFLLILEYQHTQAQKLQDEIMQLISLVNFILFHHIPLQTNYILYIIFYKQKKRETEQLSAHFVSSYQQQFQKIEIQLLLINQFLLLNLQNKKSLPCCLMNTQANGGNQQNGDNGEHQQNQTNHPSMAKKILRSLDLFSFLPVPKTKPVSSKRSLVGSLIMISLFLAYIIFGFTTFILNNAPRVNTYLNELPVANYSMPPIAFAFFQGDPFNQTINDPQIFTFSYQMIYKPQQTKLQDQQVQVPLNSCRPSWMVDQGFDLLCPSDPGIMAGALYQSAMFVYPRIQVTYCNQSNLSLNCTSQNNIDKIAAGGRILLFIKDEGPNIDLTTGKDIEKIPYRTFQFFLIPGLYPRAQIYFIWDQITIKPDFFKRFTTQVLQFLDFEDVSTWQTNVTVYNPYSAFQIFFRMELFQKVGFLYYATILDMISIWGAFWGVLFSAFATYFLMYNQESFYSENKEWEDFGSTYKVHKPKDTLDDFEEQDDQKKQEPQQQMTSRTNNTMVFEMAPL